MEIIAIVVLAAVLIAGLLVFVSLKRVVDLEIENRERFARIQDRLNSMDRKLETASSQSASQEGTDRVE